MRVAQSVDERRASAEAELSEHRPQLGGAIGSTLSAAFAAATSIGLSADRVRSRLPTSRGKSSMRGTTPLRIPKIAARNASSAWSTGTPMSHAEWRPSAVR
jgi:hypothetical protein